jgi:integrase/recombinase XerD
LAEFTEQVTLSSLAEEYLGWLAIEKGRSPNTLGAYRRDLLSATAAFVERGLTLETASVVDLEGYLADLAGRGSARASIARAASVLRGFYRFAVDEGSLSSDPTSDLRPLSSGLALPKALSVEQVGAILETCSGDDPLARRDRAVLEVLYASGARVSEVTALDVTSVDRSDGLLLVRGKGNRERIVPLGSYAAAALDRWTVPEGRGALAPLRWQRRGDESALFLTARGGRLTRQATFALLKRRAAVVGLGDVVSPHVLRHSCATHLLSNAADIRVVQEVLGHRSIATTQRYTKVDPEHLRTTLERAHPRGRPRAGRS